MTRFLCALVALCLLAIPATAAAPDDLPDGLHWEEWFTHSSLDLQQDFAEAKAEGKHLMIVVEQQACVYCKTLHEVNFQRDEVVRATRDNFRVILMDLWGDRIVTDLDGDRLPESAFMRKWGVNTTPSMIAISTETTPELAAHLPELFRLPGYLKPFYHVAVLDYFLADPMIEMDFSTWFKARIAQAETDGIDPERW